MSTILRSCGRYGLTQIRLLLVPNQTHPVLQFPKLPEQLKLEGPEGSDDDDDKKPPEPEKPKGRRIDPRKKREMVNSDVNGPSDATGRPVPRTRILKR